MNTSTPDREFRVPNSRIAMLVFAGAMFALFAALFAYVSLRQGSVETSLGFGVLALILTRFGMRVNRVVGHSIRVSEIGLTVRSKGLHRTVPWESIARIEIGQSQVGLLDASGTTVVRADRLLPDIEDFVALLLDYHGPLLEKGVSETQFRVSAPDWLWGLSGIGVIAGVVAVVSGYSPWIVFVIVGWTMVVAVPIYLERKWLEIDSTGFTMKNRWSRTTIPWSRVSRADMKVTPEQSPGDWTVRTIVVLELTYERPRRIRLKRVHPSEIDLVLALRRAIRQFKAD